MGFISDKSVHGFRWDSTTVDCGYRYRSRIYQVELVAVHFEEHGFSKLSIQDLKSFRFARLRLGHRRLLSLTR